MSRELLEFSLLIDEQFDVTEKPHKNFIDFLLSLFK